MPFLSQLPPALSLQTLEATDGCHLFVSGFLVKEEKEVMPNKARKWA